MPLKSNSPWIAFQRDSKVCRMCKFAFFTLLPFLLVRNVTVLVCICSDGASQALSSCQRDFRNKPYPVRAKIIYYKKTLTVSIPTHGVRGLWYK